METTGQRLRQARIAANFKSMKDATDSLNIKYQAYSKYENDEREMPHDVLIKCSRRYGVTISYLLTGKDNQETIVPLGKEDKDKQIVGVPLIGTVAATNWVSIDDIHDMEYSTVPSIGGYPASWQFAVRVVGTSINNVAQEGEVLLCLYSAESGYAPQHNDLVIVTRTSPDASRLERTAKRVRQTRQGWELWPDSMDPKHQEAITLGEFEGDTVEIYGKVLFVMKDPNKRI